MNEWLLAAVVLIAAVIPCAGVCVFGDAMAALVALEVSSGLSTSALMVLSEGFHREPFIDLAIVLAMLSVVGSLIFARMMAVQL